jgi:hypothetical protein
MQASARLPTWLNSKLNLRQPHKKQIPSRLILYRIKTAMTIFTLFAANSALMILMVPLGWYGYLHGIDFWNSAQWPTWYAVAYSSLGPLSSILLTPIWMLGLSLLYMDERVRHEGYDIELMASRQLGEVPDVNVSSPLGTALYTERTNPPPAPGPSGSATGPS